MRLQGPMLYTFLDSKFRSLKSLEIKKKLNAIKKFSSLDSYFLEI